MKKIMFNDRFGLTDAVLEGRKTVTRRIVTEEIYGESSIESNPPRIDEIQRGVNSKHIKSNLPKYQVGDIVAVSQRYEDFVCGAMFDNHEIFELQKHAGYKNKMFVEAELMPHKIEILNVIAERLQNITDEDCIKEGIEEYPFGWVYFDNKIKLSGGIQSFGSPREAFASLIDKLSGKGTWDSNPYVFRCEFKLN